MRLFRRRLVSEHLATTIEHHRLMCLSEFLLPFASCIINDSTRMLDNVLRATMCTKFIKTTF